MGNFVLLKDKNRCPQCRARRSFSDGHCSNCGIRLFIRPINFRAYEDDGNPRRYWLWTNSEGWIYRDHVIAGLQPLDSVVHFTSPERNTEETQLERLKQVRRDTNEQIRRIIPKKNQFGYGKSKTKLT